MTTLPDAAPLAAANGHRPALTAPVEPMTVFSPELTAAVIGPKPVAKKAKAAARGKWREVLSTVLGDLRGSWLWSAHPPAVAEVWASKVVEYDRIPFEPHRCLTIDPANAPGRTFDATGPLGQCRCPGATEKQRKEATRANWVGFALRVGWILWNFVIALPLTLVGYGFIWVHQHPARAGLFWVVAGTIWGAVRSAG